MEHDSTYRIGAGYGLVGGRYMRAVSSKTGKLDAFGNVPRKIERTAEEHRGEIIMCMAGPMAEAKLRNHEAGWRPLASRADKSIMRHHHSELGEAAQSWEEYERQTTALVDKYWPMIEAVAARLTKVEWIGGSEVDDICGRVARQHARKKLRNRI
jgi:hypothetical protein